MTAHNQEVKI
jgi:hypothetical protein